MLKRSLLLLCCLSGLSAPALGFELPFELEVSLDGGSASFDELAKFTRFDNDPDRPEERRYEIEGAGLLGFRLAVAPHPDLEIGWSRLYGSTRYRVFLDGEKIGEIVRDGVPIQLADTDLRFDLFAVRYRPSQWGRWGIKPVLSAGWGLALLSQNEAFRPPDSLPVDWSDSDKGYELTAGLEGRWRWLRAGAQVRTFHWRFETGDERIPARTTHAWIFGGWIGASI